MTVWLGELLDLIVQCACKLLSLCLLTVDGSMRAEVPERVISVACRPVSPWSYADVLEEVTVEVGQV